MSFTSRVSPCQRQNGRACEKWQLGRRVVCEPVRWSSEGAMMIGNGEVVNTGKVSVLSASLDLRVSTRPKWRKTWEKRNEGLSVKP